jgi:hypothetical protein
MRCTIEVEFAPDSRLGIVVPITMRERYGHTSPQQPTGAEPGGRATYGNFR